MSNKCKQCGKCCTDLVEAAHNVLTIEDVQPWIDEGREDILAWTTPFVDEDGETLYKIWVSPKTGKQVDRCPWVRKLPNKNKYICRIHDVKPSHCRAFKPGSKVAKSIGGRCTKKTKTSRK